MKCPLGVVSNFVYEGKLEEMLDQFGLLKHFGFVISSVEFGWRKPHRKIYEGGIENAGCEANEILLWAITTNVTTWDRGEWV